MKKGIHCLINLLLCLVIFTGAVACTTEKGTSEQKVDSIREHQSKSIITAGNNREKPDATKEVVPERVVVENNLLSNKYGVESLDEKGKALHKKLEEAGIGGIDELQEKFVRCNGSSDCERNTRDEYRIKEKEAGEKLTF